MKKLLLSVHVGIDFDQRYRVNKRSVHVRNPDSNRYVTAQNRFGGTLLPNYYH